MKKRRVTFSRLSQDGVAGCRRTPIEQMNRKSGRRSRNYHQPRRLVQNFELLNGPLSCANDSTVFVYGTRFLFRLIAGFFGRDLELER